MCNFKLLQLYNRGTKVVIGMLSDAHAAICDNLFGTVPGKALT